MTLTISQLLYWPPPKSLVLAFEAEKGHNAPVPGGRADPFSHRAQSRPGPGPGPHPLTLFTVKLKLLLYGGSLNITKQQHSGCNLIVFIVIFHS